MPFLDIAVSTPPAAAVYERIAGLLTQLTSNVLRKQRALTAIAIRHVPPGHWFIDGAALPPGGAVSFCLEIRVTAGTNTPEEKARFVDQAFDGMQAIPGTLAPASYVVIHEVGADAWGYQGRTQEFRLLNRHTT